METEGIQGGLGCMKALKETNPLCTRFVRGMIVEIDPATLQVTIQTAAGQRESLPVESSDVMKELGKGDQVVRMEMEERGRIQKFVTM
jgi:hypothetical protein